MTGNSDERSKMRFRRRVWRRRRNRDVEDGTQARLHLGEPHLHSVGSSDGEGVARETNCIQGAGNIIVGYQVYEYMCSGGESST